MKGSILFSNACKIWEDLISFMQYYIFSLPSLLLLHFHNKLSSIDSSSFLIPPLSSSINFSSFILSPTSHSSSLIFPSVSHSPSHEEVRNGMIQIMREWMVRFLSFILAIILYSLRRSVDWFPFDHLNNMTCITSSFQLY